MRIKPSRSKTPTSWSLLKLPDSKLYLKLLLGGRTFPLPSTETDGLIVEKTRENVELLSPSSFSLSFLFLFFLFFPPPTELFGPKSSGMSSLPHFNTPLAPFGFPLSTYLYLWISIISSGDTCPTWAPFRLLFDLFCI